MTIELINNKAIAHETECRENLEDAKAEEAWYLERVVNQDGRRGGPLRRSLSEVRDDTEVATIRFEAAKKAADKARESLPAAEAVRQIIAETKTAAAEKRETVLQKILTVNTALRELESALASRAATIQSGAQKLSQAGLLSNQVVLDGEPIIWNNTVIKHGETHLGEMQVLTYAWAAWTKGHRQQPATEGGKH